MCQNVNFQRALPFKTIQIYVFESYYEGGEKKNFCFQPQLTHQRHTVLIHIHGRENCQIYCIVAVWFMPQNKQQSVVC
jgi:hypothetical protein